VNVHRCPVTCDQVHRYYYYSRTSIRSYEQQRVHNARVCNTIDMRTGGHCHGQPRYDQLMLHSYLLLESCQINFSVTVLYSMQYGQNISSLEYNLYYISLKWSLSRPVTSCPVQNRRPNGSADRAKNWHKHSLGLLCDEDSRVGDRECALMRATRVNVCEKHQNESEVPEYRDGTGRQSRREREARVWCARSAHRARSAKQKNDTGARTSDPAQPNICPTLD
jgi:hypothetical protein